MFSWTIDYRRRLQRFTQDLNRLSPFNPLDCFAIHFETILIRFVHVSGFRSISGLLSILHWRGFFIGRRPGWNIWMRLAYYIKWLRVACSAICSTNHCRQSVVRISFILRARNRSVALWKVICHSQKYTRDHWVMRREALWLYAIILYNSTD